MSFLSPQACHSCPHKLCHSWHRPGIQESPCIQACHSCPHKLCHSCPHKLVIPGADQESRSHSWIQSSVIPVPTSVSFLSPQACHSCPHKLCHSWRRPGIQESPCIQACHSCPHKLCHSWRRPVCHSRSQTCNTSLSFLSPQACHSWRRPGIQESPWIQACHSCPHKRVIPVPTSVSFLAQTRNPGVTLYTSVSFLSPQACHSCPHKLVIPGAAQESRSHPGYKRVIPVPTSVSFLSPQACHSWRRPGIQESPWIQVCHSCPHKCVIPVPTSVSFLSPQVCHSWHRPGIQESPCIQACHSCPHKLCHSCPHKLCHSWRRPGIQESPWIQVCHSCPHKRVIPVPTSVSFLAQTRNPGVTLNTSVSFLSPQACHSCPHKLVIPGADQESRSHPVYKRVIPVPTSLSFLAQTSVSFHESPWIQVCHSCPHKCVIPGADQESRSHPGYKCVIPVPTSCVIPVPTSLSFLAQTRNPGVTLDTSVSFLSPQVCHSCPHKCVIPGADQESGPHKLVIPGTDQESRSHPVYKCVIPVPTSLSFLAQTRNPGVTLYTSVSFLSPQACHSCPHKRVIPVPTSVSFLSPQVCHSWPHKLVIPGADQESRSHPGYKCVIPVPTSVSFLAQTRNPGVTLYTSVSFLSPQAVSFLAQTRNPGVTLYTSVSFLSSQACHSWRRPGIQESPCIQVCHSCPHKCVIPVPASVSFLAQTRNPGVTLDRQPGGFLVCARNDNSME